MLFRRIIAAVSLLPVAGARYVSGKGRAGPKLLPRQRCLTVAKLPVLKRKPSCLSARRPFLQKKKKQRVMTRSQQKAAARTREKRVAKSSNVRSTLKRTTVARAAVRRSTSRSQRAEPKEPPVVPAATAVAHPSIPAVAHPVGAPAVALLRPRLLCPELMGRLLPEQPAAAFRVRQLHIRMLVEPPPATVAAEGTEAPLGGAGAVDAALPTASAIAALHSEVDALQAAANAADACVQTAQAEARALPDAVGSGAGSAEPHAHPAPVAPSPDTAALGGRGAGACPPQVPPFAATALRMGAVPLPAALSSTPPGNIASASAPSDGAASTSASAAAVEEDEPSPPHETDAQRSERLLRNLKRCRARIAACTLRVEACRRAVDACHRQVAQAKQLVRQVQMPSTGGQNALEKLESFAAAPKASAGSSRRQPMHVRQAADLLQKTEPFCDVYVSRLPRASPTLVTSRPLLASKTDNAWRWRMPAMASFAPSFNTMCFVLVGADSDAARRFHEASSSLPSEKATDAGTADGQPLISDFGSAGTNKTSNMKKRMTAGTLKERVASFAPPGPGQVHVVICNESTWDNL